MNKQTSKLFESYDLKGCELKNRFVMAPMTRSRSTQPNNVPNELMAAYYAQRAGAGLIITEATQISLQGQGYARTPGIYTEEHVNGWKKVTQAVHDAGSKILLQLWHVGRVSSARVNGLQPVAPSAIAAKDTSVYVFEKDNTTGDATFVPVDTPLPMTKGDIRLTVKDFSDAARRAQQAGFDGVEIHAANGYLIDQFLRANSNRRKDEYGGSEHNRIRFLVETTESVIATIGKDQTGVRLSPYIRFKDMDDPNILNTIMYAVDELNRMDIAYIHLCEADWDDAPKIPEDFRVQLRKRFKNTIIATGNKTIEEAENLLQQGLVDLIGFGRKFISNPDYPERVKYGHPINDTLKTHKLFGGGDAEGYTDYPKYTA